MRNTFGIIPVTATHKELDTLGEFINLTQIDIIQHTIALELALTKRTMRGRQGIAIGASDSCDVVKIVALTTELVLLLLLKALHCLLNKLVEPGDIVIIR